MQKIIRNKLLIILFLTFFIFISISSSCLAFDVTVNNEKITLPDIPNYNSNLYYLIYKSGAIYNLICSSIPITVTDDSEYPDSYYRYYFNGSCYYCMSSNLSSWTFNGDFTTESTPKSNPFGGNILFLNHNIRNSSGDVVFPRAPQETELAQIVTQTKPETTLQEVILLIPVVMIVLVSLIGLRKALKLLQTFLRSS